MAKERKKEADLRCLLDFSRVHENNVFLIIYLLFTIYGGKKKMAVKMRLKRMGKKRNPIYRIVVADQEHQEMVDLSKN